MGNRHGNKKRKLAVRARMASTGETYQKALSSVLQRDGRTQTSTRCDATVSGADLLAIRYFGVSAAIATFEIAGRLAVFVVSHPLRRGPFPVNPIVALGSPRVVH